MSLFTGTTEFYRRYRPGIPEEVAQVLDRATPVGRPRRLLDVGTGTGLVVEALLSRFDDVIGVDNDADMLAAAGAAPLAQPATGAARRRQRNRRMIDAEAVAESSELHRVFQALHRFRSVPE